MKNWLIQSKDEALMEEAHYPMWNMFIDSLPEEDLSKAHVLDFGCNRGGFLKLLFERIPFQKALGTDLAEEPVSIANSRSNGLPISYQVRTEYQELEATFDRIFSYEVIYLLQDLPRHAHEMRSLLKEGGVYYACTGCHTENPLWPEWKDSIQKTSNLPVPSYSLNDYASAFASAGFSVEVKPFMFSRFLPFRAGGAYPGVMDQVLFFSLHTVIFRLTVPRS